jgi:membrane associated rhomboid family serine protease
VDIIYFSISVGYDYNSEGFLKPSLKSLDDLGAKDAYQLQKEYQMWRWVTPMLLHADMFHISVGARQYNMIMQMILGFRLEPTVGIWRTVVVYVASA